MVEIIGVKFNNGGKVYYFDPKGIQVKAGESVLAETTHGVEMGKVVLANRMVEESEIVSPLKPILRIATEADFQQREENKEKEKEAFRLAVEKIAEHKLDMKLVDAEYTFDRSKILFYFTADGRVDFRELVKSLAGIFRTRIELRQIGVRDEARQLGSYGICGRYLCCSSFLNDFHPVSIKMAKEQGLSLNPTKISGVCGRLMCCLQYEEEAYEDMIRRLPRRGDKVDTPAGVGVVAEVATLKGAVRVKFQDENGESVKFENFRLGEFKPCQRRGRAEAEEVTEEITPEEAAALTEVGGALAEEEAVPPTEGEAKPRSPKPHRRNRNRSGKRPEQKKEQKAEDRPQKPRNDAPPKGEERMPKGGYSGGYQLGGDPQKEN